MPTTTIRCPFDSGYSVVLDPEQIYPDDPGMGTPELVHGPGNSTGTYHCVVDTGELDSIPVSRRLLDWLESDAVCEAIEDFWLENS